MEVEALDKAVWEDEKSKSTNKGKYRPLIKDSDEYREVHGNMKRIIELHGAEKVRDFLRTRAIRDKGKSKRRFRSTSSIKEEEDDVTEKLSPSSPASKRQSLHSNAESIAKKIEENNYINALRKTSLPPAPEKVETAPVIVSKAEDLEIKHKAEFQDLMRQFQAKQEAKNIERMEELNKLESNELSQASFNRRRSDDVVLSKERWGEFNCMVMRQVRELLSMQELRKGSTEAPGEDEEQRKERLRREKLCPGRFLTIEERAEQLRQSESHKLQRKMIRSFDMAHNYNDVSVKDKIVKPTLERVSLVSLRSPRSTAYSFGNTSLMLKNFPLLRIPADKKNMLRIERHRLENLSSSPPEGGVGGTSVGGQEKPGKRGHQKSHTQEFGLISFSSDKSLVPPWLKQRAGQETASTKTADGQKKVSTTRNNGHRQELGTNSTEEPRKRSGTLPGGSSSSSFEGNQGEVQDAGDPAFEKFRTALRQRFFESLESVEDTETPPGEEEL